MGKRIFDFITESLLRYNKEAVFFRKIQGDWTGFSASDYIEKTDLIASGLLNLGLKPGENIVIISENRPEWNYADFAIMKCGMVGVPVYPTISDGELINIINETESQLVFVSGKFLHRKVINLLKSVPSVKYIYSFDKIENESCMDDLIRLGTTDNVTEMLNNVQEKISDKDLYTILYTSGTTGAPKGVMLTHKSHLSVIMQIKERWCIKESYKALSYLPLNHSFEKTVTYLNQISGVPVYYAEGLGNIIQTFQEVKPDFFVTVPMLLERVYENILKQGNSLDSPVKEKYFKAVDMAVKYDMYKNYSEEEKNLYKQMDEMVYSKWRNILGGNLKTVVCGGAKLEGDMFHLFWAAGIPLLQGYGLTETSGVISVDSFNEKIKLNKCGKQLNDLEMKLGENNEILARGVNIMKGYYKHPELTNEVIDQNGWLKTGDIGKVDEDGYLEIVGRINSTFKNSAGKYIYPEEIENKLKKSGFISNIVIAGISKPYLVAVIVPGFEYIANLYKDEFSIDNKSGIINSPKVINEIEKVLAGYNKNQIIESEQIRKFVMIEDTWSIDGGQLTPTMKVKRNIVLNRYSELIENLYK